MKSWANVALWQPVLEVDLSVGFVCRRIYNQLNLRFSSVSLILVNICSAKFCGQSKVYSIVFGGDTIDDVFIL